jgi:transcriptional regulator with PAS, ATPase and Fis domain
VGRTVVIVRPQLGASDDVHSSAPVSDSTSMGETMRLVALVAPTDISVLLLGETGVGKGYLAEQIHARSKRASGPWLHLNCAALPDHLLESELFGYEKGAFTGATQSKPGLLEAASGGTVFLDEVGELPAAVQAKLLLALERREVLRIGGLRPRAFDVRFVSATNRAQNESGLLRADLYFRLAGLPIHVPPLRERREEIPALVATLLAQTCRKMGRTPPALGDDALAALLGYEWPGNVRELASVIERALLWSGATLEREHFVMARRASMPPSAPPSQRPPMEAGEPASSPRTLAEDVDEIARRRITEALEQCAGNQSRAAEVLGISRRTLINRMISFGLKRPRKG